MLSQEQIDAYRRDGFLLVRGVFRGEELEALQRATDRVVAQAISTGANLDAGGADPSDPDHLMNTFREHAFLYAKGPDGRHLFHRAENMWQRDEVFRLATANPELLNAVWQVREAEFVPANDSLVVKLPGAGAVVPWHRDPPGAEAVREGRDGTPDFTCDIYLDPSTVDNGCLWAIPGSHLGSPESVEPLDFDRDDIVPVEAAAGDLLLHCTALLHGSPVNTSPQTRRTFYVHYRPPEDVVEGGSANYIRNIRGEDPTEFLTRQVQFMSDMLEERRRRYPDDEKFIGRVPERSPS